MSIKFNEIPYNDLESTVNSTIDYISTVVSLSDYEKSCLRDTLLCIHNNPPNSRLVASELSAKLLSIRSNANYILLKLNSIKREVNMRYRVLYDKEYTRLTRMARPSKQSIESEMHTMVEQLRLDRDKLDELSDIIDFLSDNINLIDRLLTVIDGRRYDL